MAGNPSAACAQRGRVLVSSLIVLLCLVSLGFMDPGLIAQGDRWRMAMDPAVGTAEQKALAGRPGSNFKECAHGCPVMIVIPAGEFIMGSPENEPDRDGSEGPLHAVTIAETFAISKFEVTFEDWDACVAAAACPRAPDSWGRGEMPVINVSWGDAKQNVAWLSQLTGKEFFRRATRSPVSLIQSRSSPCDAESGRVASVDLPATG